ncbi:hypothetical protein KIPE111705_46465 [Kibdelosporangium persicum]
MDGALNVRPSATRWNSASIGSISGEWNAWLVRRRLVRRPLAENVPATSATASAAPESTTESGPLSAAMATVSGRPASTAVTSASLASTATMRAPPAAGGSSCISLPRAATSTQASSTVSTPATCAAASSPIEWPTRKSGRIPHCSSRRNNATSNANSAAWVNIVPSSSTASDVPSSAKATARSERPSNGSSRAHTSSNAPAKAGCAPCSSRPMPSRCAPCPVNRKASRPSATESGGTVPSASSSSPASSSPRSRPSTMARRSSLARAVPSVNAMSATSRSGWSSMCVIRLRACARRACAPRAETVSGTTGGATTGGWDKSFGGACSRITCALVPLSPKDDTPARRGRPASGHSTGSVTSRTAPSAQSTCGDGASTCNVFGSRPSRIADTILITPATPAAACVWPMFDFTEPSHSGRSRSRPYVAMSACASIGSPSVVPVPCASTASTSEGARPATARACRITRSCDGPLGALSPLLAPSEFTADPRSTASTG